MHYNGTANDGHISESSMGGIPKERKKNSLQKRLAFFFPHYEPVLLLPKSIKTLEFKEIDKYLSGNLCYSDKYQKQQA